jgi:hypothetical protein
VNCFDYKPHLFPLLGKERMLSIAKLEWYYKKVPLNEEGKKDFFRNQGDVKKNYKSPQGDTTLKQTNCQLIGNTLTEEVTIVTRVEVT